MRMRPPTPLLAAALAGGVATAPSFAQEQARLPITVCAADHAAACAASANRTCYRYAASDTHECGACLDRFFDLDGTCRGIADIATDADGELFRAARARFLPAYADNAVGAKKRRRLLAAATAIIASWNSRVPPPEFELGWTNETLLTAAERRGRLGVLADELPYEPAAFLARDGNRGALGRFEPGGGQGEGRRRGLAALAKADGDGAPVREAVDWAADGYTTVVKNQGKCGCCWAVSAAAAVESALMITNQTSRYDALGRNSLSFQQMISCDDREKGCEGGNILQALRYVWEHNNVNNGNFGGLFSFADWPYGRDDFFGTTTTECRAEELVTDGKTPAAFLNFPKVVNSVNDRSKFDERKARLMAAVSQQPVVAVLKSDCPLIMNYKRGVLTSDEGCECASTSCVDHAIVIVGYDTTARTPYWKLRNSWGPEYGEEGYFRIAMNDPGLGEWGLFGMLAESALPSEAYTTLDELPERPSWWKTAATWQKVLVVVASVLGFLGLCGGLLACWKKRSA